MPSDADILALAEDFKLNLQICRKITEKIKAQIEGQEEIVKPDVKMSTA